MDNISVVAADINGIRDVKRGRGIPIGAVSACWGKIKEYFVWVNIRVCKICYIVTVEIVNL